MLFIWLMLYSLPQLQSIENVCNLSVHSSEDIFNWLPIFAFSLNFIKLKVFYGLFIRAKLNFLRRFLSWCVRVCVCARARVGVCRMSYFFSFSLFCCFLILSSYSYSFLSLSVSTLCVADNIKMSFLVKQSGLLFSFFLG